MTEEEQQEEEQQEEDKNKRIRPRERARGQKWSGSVNFSQRSLTTNIQQLMQIILEFLVSL